MLLCLSYKAVFFMWPEQNGYSSSSPHLFLISFFFLFVHNIEMMGWKCHILTKHFTWKQQTLTCFFKSHWSKQFTGPRVTWQQATDTNTEMKKITAEHDYFQMWDHELNTGKHTPIVRLWIWKYIDCLCPVGETQVFPHVYYFAETCF